MSVEPIPRIRTGNAQLDDILGGGFPKNSINILMGEPGSGKTILAERMIFENATDSTRPILFLTTLSEPLTKVVRYLQQFAFFDEDKLASGAVIYDSVGERLEREGVGALLPIIKEAIKNLSPSMIVIDSFKAIHDVSTSTPQMRTMLHDLAGLLTAYETTAFLVGEYNESQLAQFPEFAVADGVVELARKKHGTRDERYLRVLKLRGSGYREGLHAFRITGDGLDVYPRLTSPDVPPRYEPDRARVSTGTPALDALLNGGVWAGSATIVEGQTGAGKTTVALQFVLEGLERGEPGVYLHFQENPTQLARTIESLGWNVAEAEKAGLQLIYASPVELQIDSILTNLFQRLVSGSARRVAIDAVGDLMLAASDPERLFGYLYALVQHFTVRRISSFMTMETSKTDGAPANGRSLDGQLSALSDAIISLRIERDADKVRRTLRVTKARGSAHDLDVHTFTITGDGIEIA